MDASRPIRGGVASIRAAYKCREISECLLIPLMKPPRAFWEQKCRLKTGG